MSYKLHHLYKEKCLRCFILIQSRNLHYYQLSQVIFLFFFVLMCISIIYYIFSIFKYFDFEMNLCVRRALHKNAHNYD